MPLMISVLLLGGMATDAGPEPPARAKTPTAVSPDRRMTATAAGKVVEVRDNQTGKLTLSIRAHADDVVAVAYAPDGKLLGSADRGGVINVFDPSTGKALWRHATGQKGAGKLAFSPDGKTLTWSLGQAVTTLDTGTGKLLR